MFIKNIIWRGVVVVFLAGVLVLNSISPLLQVAYADENDSSTSTEELTQIIPPISTEASSPTPEISSTIEPTTTSDSEIPTPTPTKTELLSPTPTDVPTPAIVLEPINQSETQIITPTNTPSPTANSSQEGTLSAVVIENSAINLEALDFNTNMVQDSATLTTDKPDYSPIDVAIISGNSLILNTDYTLIISSTDPPAVNFETKITTNNSGSFIYSYQLDGNYRPNYQVAIKDSTGTVVTTTFTDSAPTIAITTPAADGNIFTTTTPTISGTTSSASGKNVGSITWNLDSSAQTGTATCTGCGTSSATWTLTTSATGQGAHSITVTEHDATSGGTATATRIFTVDSISPTSTISNPADNSLSVSATVPLSGTSSDTNLAITQISVDGGAFQATSGSAASWTFSATGLSQATHTFQTKATDSAGNIGLSSIIHVTVDATAPIVVITSPVTGNNVNASKIITFTDNESTVPQCSIDNITFVSCTSGSTTLNDITGFSGLSQGNFTLYLKDTDTSGNIGTTNQASIIKNTIAPTAAISYSINHAVKSGDSLIVTATFSEPVIDSPAPKISVSGANTLAATNMTKTDTTHYTYTHTVGGGDGTATVALSVGADMAGNVIVSVPTSGATFSVDNTAPTGTFKINNDAAYTNSTSVNFNFSSVSADITQLEIRNGTVGSFQSPVAYANPYAYTLTVGDGTKTISVRFTDSAGNQNSGIISDNIILDTTVPTVSANDASDSWRTANLTITLSALDSGSGLNNVRYNWNSPANSSTGTVFTDGTTVNIPSEGNQILYLYTDDNAGNSNTFSGTYKLDTSDPSVWASGSSTGWQNTLPTITVSASDSVSGIASVKYAWDTDASTGSTTSNNIDLTSTFPGDSADGHTLNVLATDNSGRTKTFSGTYKIDRNNPTAPGTPSTSPNPTNSETQTWNWSAATDAISGVAQYLWRIAGGSSGSALGTSVTTNLTEGVWNFFVRAVDTADNQGSESSGGVIVDTTNPTISISSPSNSSLLNTAAVAIGGTASDTTSGVQKVEVSVDSGSYSLATGTTSWSFTTPTLSDGSHSITAKVTDNATNTSTTSITITVDATTPAAPTITIPTQTVNADMIHIIGTAEVDSTITITGGASTTTGTATGGHYDIAVTLTHNAVNNLSVTAKDAAGNESSAATVAFTHDNIAPTVTKLGNDSEDVVLDAGDTNLVFSEVLSDSSKTTITNALTAGADKSLTYTWLGATLTIHATQTTTFANDAIVNVSDIAGNIANGLLIVDSKLASTQTTPDNSGEVTVNSSTPQVVITNPTQAVDVTIDSGTTNPTIDVGSFITDGTGIIPQITINSSDASIEIPASTTVTSTDSAWDGVIAAPTVTTVTLPETSGETKTLSTAIEIGFASAKLSFDKAVRILLPGQAGKRAGYVRTGTDFTEITNTCAADTQASGDALAADGDCKVDVGADLVIWTKHFTKFASYTQTTNSTNSSNTSSSTSSLSGDSKSDGLGCGSHDCNTATNISQNQVLGPSTNQELAFAPDFGQQVLGATISPGEQNIDATSRKTEKVLGSQTSVNTSSSQSPLRMVIEVVIALFVIGSIGFWISKSRKRV